MTHHESGDEDWIEHQVEDSATDEQYLEFILGLRDLVRSTHLAAVDVLSAVDQAISQAVGGNIVDARDWAERITLGLIAPGHTEDGEDTDSP